MASHNGHDYIEIAGNKWATMNVGANSITDFGLYFQWGDTTGYLSGSVGTTGTTYAKPYEWNDYKFNGGRKVNVLIETPNESGLTKYNSGDSKTELEICDDAARAHWGGNWKIPSYNDYAALSAATTAEWVIDYQGSGIRGTLLTDKNDSTKKLFLPAAGNLWEGSHRNPNSAAHYFSSTKYVGVYALGTIIRPAKAIEISAIWRYSGCPIRAIVGS